MKARCFSFVTMQPPITHMHTHNHACTYETLSGIRGVVPEGILWGVSGGKKTKMDVQGAWAEKKGKDNRNQLQRTDWDFRQLCQLLLCFK